MENDRIFRTILKFSDSQKPKLKGKFVQTFLLHLYAIFININRQIRVMSSSLVDNDPIITITDEKIDGDLPDESVPEVMRGPIFISQVSFNLSLVL